MAPGAEVGGVLGGHGCRSTGLLSVTCLTHPWFRARPLASVPCARRGGGGRGVLLAELLETCLPRQISLSEAGLLSLAGNLLSSADQSHAVPSSAHHYLLIEAGPPVSAGQCTPVTHCWSPLWSLPPDPVLPSPPCLLRTPLLQSWACSLRALPVRFSLPAYCPLLPQAPSGQICLHGRPF